MSRVVLVLYCTALLALAVNGPVLAQDEPATWEGRLPGIWVGTMTGAFDQSIHVVYIYLYTAPVSPDDNGTTAVQGGLLTIHLRTREVCVEGLAGQQPDGPTLQLVRDESGDMETRQLPPTLLLEDVELTIDGTGLVTGVCHITPEAPGDTGERPLVALPLPTAETLTEDNFGETLMHSLPPDVAALLDGESKAAQKREDVRSLNDACTIFENDTGAVPETVGDLVAAVGRAGYSGPYLKEEPRDPYTGKPYELTDGKVTGPGDVWTFRN
jgi:hypothetical protein